ncbi:hypothetical protein DICVIV_04723 [Dictyocaulus viviparus]|uniref:Uncharacterized protein n=1 Tax=Dictyocaulus viviparus TaxID=29172 RepID=A0A0D8XZG7_DICVI|nr:hypothetical protein DICVIV_04723 [Dictyocaulus viviparus]
MSEYMKPRYIADERDYELYRLQLVQYCSWTYRNLRIAWGDKSLSIRCAFRLLCPIENSSVLIRVLTVCATTSKIN